MAAQPGPVGAVVHAPSWQIPPPGGGNWTQAAAWQAWNSQTGTTAQCHKIYFGTSDGTGSTKFFPVVPDTDVRSCIDLGIKAVLCYKPSFDTQAHMANDLAAFTTSVHALSQAGLQGYVVLWQEVEDNITAAQYLSLVQFDPNGTGIGGFHAAAQAAGFPLYWNAAGSKHTKWASYNPGPAPGGLYIDGIAVDLYAFTWVQGGKNPDYLKPLTDIADANHLPFGWFEVGLVPTNVPYPAQADFTDYINWGIQLFGYNPAQTVPNVGAMPAGRLARGLANGPVMWYDGAFHINYNQIVPMPGHITYDTYAVQTAYPALWNALQPRSPTTLTITTTTLPNGVTGVPYSAVLHATGGTTPYTWSRISGSLPAGLSLTSNADNTATISGTPS